MVMGTSGTKLLLMAMSVLMSIVHVTAWAHVNHVMNHVLNHVLMYEDHAELAPPLTGSGRASPIPYQRAAEAIWETSYLDIAPNFLVCVTLQ